MGRCRLGAAEETAMGRGLPTGTGKGPRARGQAPPPPRVRGCSPDQSLRTKNTKYQIEKQNVLKFHK